MTRKDQVKVGIVTACLLAAGALLAWQLGALSPSPAHPPEQPVIQPGADPVPRGGMMLPPAERK